METLPKRTVVETLQSTEEYGVQLELLLNSVISAESQVEKSAKNACEHVEATFNKLRYGFLKNLEARKAILLDCINNSQAKASEPLNQCRLEVAAKLAKNKQFIAETKDILKSGGFKSPQQCNDFLNHSSSLGELPVVPESELVPNITFNASLKETETALREVIDNFGQIFRIGPVQITDLEPKPGALLVRWEEVDIDCVPDIQVYNLQMAVGEHLESDEMFKDVYTGTESEFLVTNLRPLQKYSFRICCKINAHSAVWSSWSLLKSASTNIPPFNWSSNNSKYCVSDDNRLARVIYPESILFSKGPQITSGTSVRFTLLSDVEALSEEGVGLTVSNFFKTPCLALPGAFFVSFNGEIYIDGAKKVISLPKMRKDSCVIFSCSLVNGRWRVNVESASKGVTYEWRVDCHQLFFAACLTQPDVKVLVE